MTIDPKWLAMLLSTAACSRTTCVESPVAPPRTSTAPATSSTRTLTLDEYEKVVYGPGPQATFAKTTATEHEVMDKLVREMLEGARAAKAPDPGGWQAVAAGAGFRIEVWTVDGQTYWALLEAEGQVRGAGAYVFRVGQAASEGPTILLQAPHNFFDLGTGRLAAEMFFGARPGPRPAALFTNTIHRYQLAPGDKKKRAHNPADIAHDPEHAFTVATLAFARVAGSTRVIQIHGFGSRTEDDEDGDTASIAMVISAGDAAGSTPLTTALAAALVDAFGPEVKRFPEDVRMLGATTNAQGRRLREVGGSAFVHLELSSVMRKRLEASAPARDQLAAILFNPSADRK
ncbi:MAG: hypothetical protein H0T42_06595 [Deltaproteobacteria bacterium]|nr:hypothetical protein [Deltaproteobacteria bacterium]